MHLLFIEMFLSRVKARGDRVGTYSESAPVSGRFRYSQVNQAASLITSPPLYFLFLIELTHSPWFL